MDARLPLQRQRSRLESRIANTCKSFHELFKGVIESVDITDSLVVQQGIMSPESRVKFH